MERRPEFAKILFIVNPVSGGKGKERILKIAQKNLDAEHFTFEFETPNDPKDVVRRVRESNADIVVAVGGDGTVNLVAQGIIGSNKILGIVPCGSGNGLALHLGISLRIKKAIKTIQKGKVDTIDYGVVNEHPFFCTAGVGLDANVASAFALNNKRGFKSYAKLTWRFLHHLEPCTYTICIDDEMLTVPAFVVTVGNANQWGNHAMITPLASVKDGLLDLMVVLQCKVYDIPSLAAKIMDGRIYTSHNAIMLRGRSITIIRQSEGPAQYDGEPCILGEVVKFNVVQSSLKIIVPTNRSI